MLATQYDQRTYNHHKYEHLEWLNHLHKLFPMLYKTNFSNYHTSNNRSKKNLIHLISLNNNLKLTVAVH